MVVTGIPLNIGGTTHGVVVIADFKNRECCKCKNTEALQKYRGKYYCPNCLDKKLRW